MNSASDPGPGSAPDSWTVRDLDSPAAASRRTSARGRNRNGRQRVKGLCGRVSDGHVSQDVDRLPVATTACALRTTGFNVVIISQWTSGSDTERSIAWARETFSSLTPYLAPTRYVNYLESDATAAAAAAYGPNLRRLRDLKTKWDPDNFFHYNVNIPLASGEVPERR